MDTYGEITPEADETYEDAMISEIYERGPISCGIYAYEALDNYTGGVFCEEPTFTDLNHAISIVGYGTDE